MSTDNEELEWWRSLTLLEKLSHHGVIDDSPKGTALREQAGELTQRAEELNRVRAAGAKMRTWLRDHANTPCVNDWDALPRF